MTLGKPGHAFQLCFLPMSGLKKIKYIPLLVSALDLSQFFFFFLIEMLIILTRKVKMKFLKNAWKDFILPAA